MGLLARRMCQLWDRKKDGLTIKHLEIRSLVFTYHRMAIWDKPEVSIRSLNYAKTTFLVIWISRK